MFCGFLGHKWRTVAIDTSCQWFFTANPDKPRDHILLYQICDRCGSRQMEYDDAEIEGRNYAVSGNSSVAERRSKWIRGGVIVTPKNLADITYVDPNYAPLRGYEQWVNGFKKDPEMAELLKHQMVDDALGQLEVAIKLHVNNAPVKNAQNVPQA
jgi:hypothetical protein